MDKINERIIDKVIETAKRAGEEIIRIYETGNFGTELKPDASPVTRADLASNEIICAGLKRFSPYPVVSEESAAGYAERKNWRRFWLVDPLDGTKDFIAKNGHFTVNIALIDGETPVLGVIYIPARNDAYWAERGRGAYRNGARIYNPSKRTDLIAADSVFHSSAETKAFLEKNNITRIKRLGSSLKYCALAEGEIDIYPRFNGTKEWDTAAGQALLAESGCKIIDLTTKQTLTYNKPDIRNNFFLAMRGDLDVDYESYRIGGGGVAGAN